MADKKETRASRIRMGRRVFTLLISIVIALIAYSFLPIWGIRFGRLSNGEWLSVALVIVVTVRIHLSRKHADLATRVARSGIVVTAPPKTSNAREDIAADCANAFRRCVDAPELDLFIDVVSDPGLFVVRISEKAIIGAHDYETSVCRAIVPPKQFTGNLLLPVLRPKKGELIDNFSLSISSGYIRTLSRRESIGASLAVLTTLFDTAFDGHPDPPDHIWRSLRDEILNNDPTDQSVRSDLMKNLQSEFAKDSPSTGSLIARANLWNFSSELFAAYSIIAVVPIANGVGVSVDLSYTRRREPFKIPNERSPLVRGWFWLHIQAQLLLGLVARTDEYKLTRSLEAQSYHFRAEAPDGMYVYDIASAWIDEDPAYDTPQFAGLPLRPIQPDWVVSDTRGLDHVHAYGRDLDVWCRRAAGQPGYQTSGRTALVMFELREKPPGLLFVVSLMSAYLALLVLAVSRWYDAIFSADPVEKTPWPVIIFGIPAIVSGWMVSRFTADSVKLLSVSTISVTFWAILNATASVALSAFSMSGVFKRSLAYFAGFTDVQIAWSLLCLSSIACLTMALILLGLRVRRYGRRVRGLSKPIGRQMGV